MSLIVFDMGRRVETPVRPEKTRINPTQPSQAIAPVANAADAYTRSQSAYDNQRHAEHQPQAVAYVSDIMHRPVRYIHSDASVLQAWELMQQTGYHHIPVVAEDLSVYALLSDRDLLPRALKASINWQQPVLDFASHPVLCILEQADIRQCARTMLEYQIGALPVINDNNILSGMITRTDILRVISHYGPMELWA